MKPAKTVRVVRRLRASAPEVFAAWLDARLAAHWLFATAGRPLAIADIDARVDGAFRFVDRRRGETLEYRGAYTSIVPDRRVAFTLSDADATASRVDVEIAPLAGGCEVRLVHDGVGHERAADVRGRWAGMLYGLDSMLAAASDPASNDRSMK